MARETIYVPLGGGPGDRAALEAALQLARLLDAEIQAAFLGPDMAAALMVAGDGVSGLGAPAIEALREERRRAEAEARALADGLGVAMTAPSGPRGNVTAPARLAALAVVDPDAARGHGALVDVFEALLLEDGVPVFVPRGRSAIRSAAVAWDGSREAAHALKAAGPLLVGADEVRVVQAPGALDFKDSPCADPALARDWLERHGFKGSVEIVTVEGAPREGLAEAAKAGGGVDVLVTGAYGHTRLREAVFGGVTRSILAEDGPSVLLAH